MAGPTRFPPRHRRCADGTRREGTCSQVLRSRQQRGKPRAASASLGRGRRRGDCAAEQGQRARVRGDSRRDTTVFTAVILECCHMTPKVSDGGQGVKARVITENFWKDASGPQEPCGAGHVR